MPSRVAPQKALATEMAESEVKRLSPQSEARKAAEDRYILAL
jgi:hypothetical protein